VTRLSPTQQTLVDRLRRESMGGRIERRPGGFWTAPETISSADGVPDWYVTTHTIQALAKRGVLVQTATRTNGSGGLFVVEYQLAEMARPGVTVPQGTLQDDDNTGGT